MAWADSVQTVGKWYEANIHDYNQGGYDRCSVPLCGSVRHDCSGYVSACLRNAGIIKTTQIYRSGDFLVNGTAAPQLRQAGFVPIPYNINEVQPFDIIARNGHVEIYAGKVGNSMRSWSWGSCHDGRNSHAGMPAYMSKQAYVVMWRMGGNGPGTPQTFDWSQIPMDTGSGGGGTNNYQTFSTSVDQSVFTNALNNSFTPAVEKLVENNQNEKRTRIYSAINPTITVDELSMPMNERTLDTAQSEQQTQIESQA